MSSSYPTGHLDRIAKAWAPPHHRPRGGEETGSSFELSVIRRVVAASFFASLRAEEGKPQRHGIVLVEDPEQLGRLDPPWFISRLNSPVGLDAERIAKLAGVASDDDSFLVVAGDLIVGFGKARDSSSIFAQDSYPRVRAVGPGDLVIYRGDSAVLRYRAGHVEELRPDFFVASEEPRAALIEIGHKVFAHWNNEASPDSKDVVAAALSRLLESIGARGRGGMLAILAPDEQTSSELIGSSSYPMAPIKLGEALVSSYESSMTMDDLLRDSYQLDRPGLTAEEVSTDAALRDAVGEERRILDQVSAMAGIDGAVLINAALEVLAFGCKIPTTDGNRPKVRAAPTQGAYTQWFDLTTRGTRHAAAAAFVQKKHGRLAFTVSADGPSACFAWSEQHQNIVHWPVHVGLFAPSAWDTVG